MTTTGSAEVSVLRNAPKNRVMIEQAKGYLAQQYDVSIDDAFDLLRTYCRRNSLPLGDVASKVLAGTDAPDLRTHLLCSRHADQRTRTLWWMGAGHG